MDKVKILVVDDESRMRKLVRDFLTRQNYEVLEAADGEEALDIFYKDKAIALLILDVMMPKMNGWEVCREIRQTSKVPIIMLTAKGEDTDKLMGFDCGADDYMTKPFNILELKARVKALLKRAAGSGRQEKSEEITVGALTLDQREHVVRRGETRVELTAKEYDLLELLMKHPRRVYSREVLMNVVWGYEYQGDFRTVDVHVRRLREKIEENPAQPEYILTKWGVGYYFKG